MKSSLARLSFFVLGLVTLGFTVWAGLVIWFTWPTEAKALRLVLIALMTILGLIGMAGCLYRRMFLLLPLVVGIACILAWWSSIEPRNDRVWERDVAVLARAEINGDRVTLRNIRNFVYRSEKDYTPHWYDKTFDLRQLDSVDLLAVYWMGDAIAHTFVSFGFGPDRIAFSIETRKERGEQYSTLAGFFRRYELYYVVGDERDLIGLRTTYRRPPEDVYLYRVFARKDGMRKLFLQYIKQINSLNKKPAFYNTLTTNCTTKIVSQIRAFSDRMPVSWKILLSGYFPELLYELGLLDQALPFPELRSRSNINRKARAVDGDEAFSRLIREGLPGM